MVYFSKLKAAFSDIFVVECSLTTPIASCICKNKITRFMKKWIVIKTKNTDYLCCLVLVFSALRNSLLILKVFSTVCYRWYDQVDDMKPQKLITLNFSTQYYDVKLKLFLVRIYFLVFLVGIFRYQLKIIFNHVLWR